MGLDYGSKTVGVAISDPLGITAQGIETITRKDENKLRKTCARIEALIEEYQVEKIVIGLPKHMNNDNGIRRDVKKTDRSGSADVGRKTYNNGSGTYPDRKQYQTRGPQKIYR